MKNRLIVFALLVLLVIQSQAQTVTDIDGNVYHTVTIGTQIWMKENLKVSHYRTGDAIPKVMDSLTWGNLNTGAICDYQNDTGCVATFGHLYNWYAVNDPRKCCPTGWHIPSDLEWTEMANYLGGFFVAGGKLKATGTSLWQAPNEGATNETGFTALPGGCRWSNGEFTWEYLEGIWQSSYTDWVTGVGVFMMGYNHDDLIGVLYHPKCGFSVRCVCDQGAGLGDNGSAIPAEIFPNPATDKIFVVCNKYRNVNVSVYSVEGKLVVARDLTGASGEIDISSLDKGIYVIQLRGADVVMQQKLIKE